MKAVFHNITHGSHFDPYPCDHSCEQELLPFEVELRGLAELSLGDGALLTGGWRWQVNSLAELCKRGEHIRRVYSKCSYTP